MADTGSFNCSNEMVNQLQSNIYWGQSDNFVDVPTDCPQRDERLGWTGDAQVFAATAMYNRNTARFFTKWLRDLASEQAEDGGVPHVVPDVVGSYSASAWSDAATIIPWDFYETYADTRLLEEQYDSMKGWVDYITNHAESNGLWMSGYQYGDWLALDKEESADRTGATDQYLIANAYYLHSTDIVRRTASLLGRNEDEKKYEKLYADVLRAFRQEYFTPTGRMVSETQTALTLALHFDLAEEKDKAKIAQLLKNNIAAHKNHLSTGFVGTPYICHALSEHDMHELAGTLFLREDYPSWLYAVKKGATTIWERWNSILPNGDFDVSGMNSLNHYAYGSIGEWMYKKLAGINAMEPGYKKFYIKPMFIKGITSVSATFESVYGSIKSEWMCKDKNITVNIEVPANTTAIICLPEKNEPIELGSGVYSFEYSTDTQLEIERYTMETTLGEIANEPIARQIIEQAVPGFFDAPMIQYAYGLSLVELLTQAQQLEPVFQAVIASLNQQ
jgi:alpha-L-rhamnosidase